LATFFILIAFFLLSSGKLKPGKRWVTEASL